MLSTKKTSNNEIFKLVNQINLLCSATLTKSYTDLRLTYITKGDTQRAKLPLLQGLREVIGRQLDPNFLRG